MRDCENSDLAFDRAGGLMDDLLGHSITYRVAMGPRAGQRVFTLQTVPGEPPQEQKKGVAQAAGFSLHAGLEIEADARAKLERLCRHVSNAQPPTLSVSPRNELACHGVSRSAAGAGR